MTCMHCRASMERGSAPFHIDRRGYHLTLDAVQAWLCPQCGELYFSEADVERLQDLLAAVDRKAEAIAACA